ncbi:MAG: hypothetical protein NVSMB19_12460 [Vulcanimicrobiaceae bacterium]
MAERFISLAACLRAPGAGALAAPTAEGREIAPLGAGVTPPANAHANANANAGVAFAHADVVHELTMLRLAALEAYESATRRLIADLAHDVLGRELALAPVDIEALVARALAAFADLEPIALAVAPADRERVRAPLPVRADATLAAGDLVVYVRDGAFESPYAFRLADALQRHAPGGVL